MTGIKRILLECTGTYKTEVNTGIQRVVRNIIKESQTIGKDLEVKCLPVISRHSRLWKVDKVAGYHGQLWNNFIIYLKNVYKNFCSLLYAIFPFRPVGRFLFPAPERFGLSSIIRTVFHIAILPTTLILYFCRRKINPRKGDLLLMLDSSWAYPIWPAVKWAKAKGATVGLVVHDILPITQPHFFVPDTIERFQVWFDQAVDTADFFVTVSQTIHNEVKKYLEFRRPAVNWGDRLDSFKLGSVIDNVIKNGPVRDELKKISENSDKPGIYLTIGTIEPRKNHKYLLDAFDKIWERYPDVCLCIVGRSGWFSDAILERIRSHPKYRTTLFMFNNLSDTELDYCYNHSKAMIFPSCAEGFGLPIVEALQHKLPVLASNIPIFKEVGGEFCSYFDINDTYSLIKMIIDIETKGKMPQIRNPKEYKLPIWKDSCRELLTKSAALYEKMLFV